MIHGLGKLCLDNLMFVDHYPKKNSLVHIERTESVMGGMVANALKAADNLGSPTALYAYRGNDICGELLDSALRKTGINIDQLIITDNTDYSNIIVHGEIRTIMSCRANQHPKTAFDFQPLLEERDILLVDGTTMDGLGTLLREAKEKKVLTVMDISPANTDSRLKNLFPYVDYLIPSLDWGKAYTGFANPDDIAGKVGGMGTGRLIMTDGSEPVLFYNGKTKISYFPEKITVKNSNGAGDTFHGAFCHGLARGWDPEEIIPFSMAAASRRCLCDKIEQIPGEGELLLLGEKIKRN